LTAPVPYLPQANVSGDYEQDLTSSRRIAGVGADYQLSTQGRLYMRHEFLNSISGQYALNGVQQQNATVFGVDTSYMKDGKVFSEYRARDALYGREAQAAIGLRNKWNLAPGLTANTTIERVQNLHGPATNGVGTVVGTAVTGAIEYTASPLWKGTARIERRFSQGNDAFLNTVGIGYKLSRDWTALGKNTLSFTQIAAGEKIQDHVRTGVAFRQTDANRWNGLGRYEYKYEHDPGDTGVAITRQGHILATDWSYHPSKPWTLMTGYAFKWVV
jgi:large repetitive protein